EALRMRAEIIGGPRAADWMEQARSRALAILAEEELIRARRAEQERVNERFERDARRLRLLLSALRASPSAQLNAPGVAPAGETPGAAGAAAALGPYAGERAGARGPLAQRWRPAGGAPGRSVPPDGDPRVAPRQAAARVLPCLLECRLGCQRPRHPLGQFARCRRLPGLWCLEYVERPSRRLDERPGGGLARFGAGLDALHQVLGLGKTPGPP